VNERGLSHFVRAFLAIVLTFCLPAILYMSDAAHSGGAVQAYQGALAGVVAFYFGSSSSPSS